MGSYDLTASYGHSQQQCKSMWLGNTYVSYAYRTVQRTTFPANLKQLHFKVPLESGRLIWGYIAHKC